MTNKERAEELFHKYAAPRRVGHVDVLTIGTCDVEKIIEAERRATLTACLDAIEQEKQPIQVACPGCGGHGGFEVSPEMASDAGDKSMAGHVWGCSQCNGGGWLLQEQEPALIAACERIATRLKQLEEQK